MKSSITIYTVFDVFSDPLILRQFDQAQWQSLIRVLRGADLLASFYYHLQHADLLQFVPDYSLNHLLSAKVYADRQVHQVKNESADLTTTLAKVNIKPIFLKGAAYVLSGDANHCGRIMSDIDILVKKIELPIVEQTLKKHHWIENKLDDYDQQYYRQWAHELPPFRHIYRGTTLDIHFTLLPPVSGKKIVECSLFSDIQTTKNNHLVLSPELRVLHCIIHLLFNEDFSKSFRDVLDVHILLNQINDLHDLIALASNMGFSKELYYALKVRDNIFNTACTSEYKIYSPKNSFVSRFFINKILYRAVMPSHDLVNNHWNKFACFIMYIRGHMLKMPFNILLPHMLTKTRRWIVTSIMGAHHYEK